jgi:branched-chain amino acid transport system ATP-binding protein
MLQVETIDVYIQASHILREVSLEVGEREVVCLIGRNGAGKTTTLRTVMGYLAPHAGRIRLGGRDLAGLRPFQVARLGVGFAPEDGGVFAGLTVAENVEIATWTRETGRPAGERVALAFQVFPALRRYAARKGTQLSGGERKMLSIARALALDPAVLLLDEPFEGLAPAIVPEIARSIVEITRLGRAVLIAESNVHHVPEYASRLYVIERGEIIYAGPPGEVQRDAGVMRVIGGAPEEGRRRP